MRLFISDKCMGLVESLGDFYPEALWQRCTVHFYRNVFTNVPKAKAEEVAAMLKEVSGLPGPHLASSITEFLFKFNWKGQSRRDYAPMAFGFETPL